MKSKKIIELKCEEARNYFLEEDSYVNFDLPYYFNFSTILEKSSLLLGNNDVSCFFYDENFPKDCEDVNYVFLSNKDGAFAWRPFQLIHPILYVDLVNFITRKDNWDIIVKRFKDFNLKKICCISIPLVSGGEESHKASQVINWWEQIEQQSLKKAIDYNYIFITDITNCYGSIYTHSIDWSLLPGGRLESKNNIGKKIKTIGSTIDQKIRNMTYGQTNGIPQGSVVMDFIAEIVLGYSDIMLSEILKKEKIKDFYILRYRDDYRIFVNNPVDGRNILKCLNKVLYDFGLKMNTSKTFENGDVVLSSIKKEKLEQIFISPKKHYWQKELLRIYQISKQYPNAGIIQKELSIYHDKLRTLKAFKDIDIEVLISILSGISFNSPNTINWVSAIISIFLNGIESKKRKDIIIKKIHKKFKNIPNSSLIDVWLQRISVGTKTEINYEDRLTKLALKKLDNSQIWISKWLSPLFVKQFDSVSVSILKEEIKNEKINPVISRKEVELFRMDYGD